MASKDGRKKPTLVRTAERGVQTPATEDRGKRKVVRSRGIVTSFSRVMHEVAFWKATAIIRNVTTLTREVVSEFATDNCHHLAAAISYYLLFSLFPLALAITSVIGFILRSQALEAQVIEGIGNFLPVSGDFIANTIQGVVRARGVTGIAATIGLIWAGTSVFNVVRKSLNTAWCIRQPRHFFLERLLELSMLVGASLILFGWVLLTAILRVTRGLDLPVFGSILAGSDFFWDFVVACASTAIAFVVFLLLYKFIPNTDVRWKDIWLGALAAAVSFEVIKTAFVWFVSNFSQYNLVYGSVGTVIALLVWTYLSAVTFLFWAKVTSVYARRRCLLPTVVSTSADSKAR